MGRRVCYIHIGPHKTGTSAIQWFLKENRAALLQHGYLVPDSGTPHGAHHPLARKLCGLSVPTHQEHVADDFTRELERTASEAVVISSETLEALLRHAACAKTFFNRVADLGLRPKLVLFARNQSQALNSRYAEAVRSFCLAKPFDSFAHEVVGRPNLRYCPLLEVAAAHGAEVMAEPFTGEIVGRGVVGAFLRAIGLDPTEFQNIDRRRNSSVGPFTVSVARRVSATIDPSGNRFKWRQAMRCKAALANYLEENRLADTGYCGLTNALARELDAAYATDNNAFAQQVWGANWNAIFAGDLEQKFAPNDFDICAPDKRTEELLARAAGDVVTIAQDIMRDPLLAVDAPWNDLRQRGGWVAQAPATVPAKPRG